VLKFNQKQDNRLVKNYIDYVIKHIQTEMNSIYKLFSRILREYFSIFEHKNRSM